MSKNTTLIFQTGFDERKAFEAQARGYLSHVEVKIPTGEHFEVLFYDATRLKQDLEVESNKGSPFIAEPGMIVLTEVTLQNMEKAVEDLYLGGFFSQLKSRG